MDVSPLSEDTMLGRAAARLKSHLLEKGAMPQRE
jgi:hypothetical protein